MTLHVLKEVRTSNMATYRKCKRKAFLEVVCGEKGPDKGYLTFGTITHYIIQRWLQFAELPPQNITEVIAWMNRVYFLAVDGDADAIEFNKKVGVLVDTEVLEAAMVATKGLALLPAPGPGLVIEEPFETVLDLGPTGQVTFRSHGIDLYDTRPESQLKRHADGTPIRLYDHKTCKTLRHVPSPDAMRDDVQAISYAHELMRQHRCDPTSCGPRCEGWGDVIGCRWIYYPRSNDAAVAVDFKFTWVELQQKWSAIVDDVREFARLAAELGPEGWAEVEGSLDHCDAYGGCAFRSRCGALNGALGAGAAADGPSLFNNPPEAGKDGSMGLLDRARKGDKVGAEVSAPMPQAALQAAAAPQATPAAGAQPVVSQSLFAQKVVANGMTPPPAGSLPPPQTSAQLHNTLAASLQAAGIDPAVEDESDDDEPGEDESEAVTVTTPSGRVVQVDPAASARVRALLDATEGLVPQTGAVGINPPDAAPADVNPPEPVVKPKKGRPKKEAVVVPAGAALPPSMPAGAILQQTTSIGEALIVEKLRERAEARFEQGNYAAAAEIFVIAQLLDRGAL